MKSDEEFIAGIYQKAEERKIEEAAQHSQSTGRVYNLRAWRPLAVAACLCLVLSGAVYAGSRTKWSEEGSPAPQSKATGENEVMALSLEESGEDVYGDDAGPRSRTMPDEKNGGGVELAGVLPEKNTATQALWAGSWLAYPPGCQNPAGEENEDIPQETGGN